MEPTRIVLKPAADRRVHDDLVQRMSWSCVAQLDREGVEPSVEILTTPDADVEIHYIEDHVLGLSSLHFYGPGTEAVLGRLSGVVEAYGRDEVLRTCREARDTASRVRALYLLGASAPAEEDAEYLACLNAQARAPDSRVREAVLLAAGHMGWDSAYLLVQRMAEEDSDAEIRGLARRLLEEWDEDDEDVELELLP